MDDAKYSFIEDVKARKSIASGARHKKIGSKSKKCTLPSDSLSWYQRRKLNGEVKSYMMNRPMTWKEFKTMPDDLQETYLATLVDAFHIGSVQIGKMMGISNSTINTLIRTKNFTTVHCKKGTPVYTREDAEAWNEFLGEWPTGHIGDYSHPTSEHEDTPVVVEEKHESSIPMQVSNFSVGYKGDINLKEVFEYLQLMLGDNFNGHLEVSFNK